jgi:hypothetical protein
VRISVSVSPLPVSCGEGTDDDGGVEADGLRAALALAPTRCRRMDDKNPRRESSGEDEVTDDWPVGDAAGPPAPEEAPGGALGDEAERAEEEVVDVDVDNEGSEGSVAGLPSMGRSVRSISPLSSTSVERAEMGRPFSPSNRLRICSPMSSLSPFSLVVVDDSPFLAPSVLRRPCLPPLDRSPLAAFRFLPEATLTQVKPASSSPPPARRRPPPPPPLPPPEAPPPPPSGPVESRSCGTGVEELPVACGSPWPAAAKRSGW